MAIKTRIWDYGREGARSGRKHLCGDSTGFEQGSLIIQRGDLSFVRGLVKFVPALAYLFCLALPGSWLARFTNLLRDLCIGAYFPLSESVKVRPGCSKSSNNEQSDYPGSSLS